MLYCHLMQVPFYVLYVMSRVCSNFRLLFTIAHGSICAFILIGRRFVLSMSCPILTTFYPCLLCESKTGSVNLWPDKEHLKQVIGPYNISVEYHCYVVLMFIY